ncbi:type II toxin-antitoxin system RelE/ParE family toxin [Marinomonas sp. M1K-6]|uniref:Toxin n=1 Tax=Marinomonas profundi TaxID=2726122 RepID=A0A847RAG1_9GAMM|nr:type II toxin-antitoxin system RelE/ParE family toxin [Marinomonas profundi]NLQ17944.1 type II toxin-antitoxin system RelE/ParE family toxin [Marinomonas profundi]UDV01671.1 type II toxin-antitoxin system RelE/ParE family toxin [Marinomonas profundi]
MSLFLISRAARGDLKNIAAYTQKTWGTEQRRSYIKELDRTFLFLAENPMSGTPCDYIISGLKKHRHESHTIFYENKDNSIFIVRVLHKSMDTESQLEKP